MNVNGNGCLSLCVRPVSGWESVPASHPMAAGIGCSPPLVTLIRLSRTEWMDGCISRRAADFTKKDRTILLGKYVEIKHIESNTAAADQISGVSVLEKKTTVE